MNKIKATLNGDFGNVTAGMQFFGNYKSTYGTLTAILNEDMFSCYELDMISKRFGLSYSHYAQLIIKTSAKATCAEGDVYNETIGKRIVESRCKVKLYKKLTKIIDYVCKMRHDDYIDLKEEMLKYYYRIKVEIDHIKELAE